MLAEATNISTVTSVIDNDLDTDAAIELSDMTMKKADLKKKKNDVVYLLSIQDMFIC